VPEYVPWDPLRWNASNTRALSTSGTPMPRSATASRIQPGRESLPAATVTSAHRPGGTYLIALPIRLSSTRRSIAGSAATWPSAPSRMSGAGVPGRRWSTRTATTSVARAVTSTACTLSGASRAVAYASRSSMRCPARSTVRMILLRSLLAWSAAGPGTAAPISSRVSSANPEMAASGALRSCATTPAKLVSSASCARTAVTSWKIVMAAAPPGARSSGRPLMLMIRSSARAALRTVISTPSVARPAMAWTMGNSAVGTGAPSRRT
jgi:hypothetical protein